MRVRSLLQLRGRRSAVEAVRRSGGRNSFTESDPGAVLADAPPAAAIALAAPRLEINSRLFMMFPKPPFASLLFASGAAQRGSLRQLAHRSRWIVSGS